MSVFSLNKTFTDFQKNVFSQPIFTMSAQQKQLQKVSAAEFKAFVEKYLRDDVSMRNTIQIQDVICCVYNVV